MSDYQTEFRNLAARFREIETQQSLDNLLAQAGRILLLAIEEGHFPELVEWSEPQTASLTDKFNPGVKQNYLGSVWTSFLMYLSLRDDTSPANPRGLNWKQIGDDVTVGSDPDLLSTARNSAEICDRLAARCDWITILDLEHLKDGRSGLSRKSDNPDKYGLRRIAHGQYQVRSDKLQALVRPAYLHLYRN